MIDNLSDLDALLIALLVGVVGYWAKGVIESVVKSGDRQGSISERVAINDARLAQLEDIASKLADTNQRLAKIEEWRLASEPRLGQAEDTTRAVIAIGEQMRTAFRRIDSIDAHMADLPRLTAEMILRGLRPDLDVIQGGRGRGN